MELVRVSFENIRGFHSLIQGHDAKSKISKVTIQDLKINGRVITKASDGLIDIGANTTGIAFVTS